MSVKNLLKSTVTVQSLATSTNAIGGVAKTFSTRLANIPAGFRARKLDENLEFDKTTERNAYRMYLDYTSANAAVAVTDRVIWGSRTLEVTGIPYDPGGRNVILHIDCEEVN